MCFQGAIVNVNTCELCTHKMPSYDSNFYWQILRDLSFWRSKHETGIQVQPAVMATCICFWEISNCFYELSQGNDYHQLLPWEEMCRDTCGLLFGGERVAGEKTRYRGNWQPWTLVKTRDQLPASPRLPLMPVILKVSPKLWKRKPWWLDLEPWVRSTVILC